MSEAGENSRMRRFAGLAILGSAAILCAGCSLFGSSKPPASPPHSNPGQQPPPNPGNPPGQSQPASPGQLTFQPSSIGAQVYRSLDPDGRVDVRPVGMTLEGRIESRGSDLPLAVEPDLEIIEARDENGRDLLVGSTSSPGFFTAISLDPGGPRWFLPDRNGTNAVAQWQRYGLAAIPRRLSRLRGTAIAYIITETQQRDVGIVAGRGRIELLPNVHLNLQGIRRDGQAVTVQATFDRDPPMGDPAAIAIHVPRIVRASFLDQKGEMLSIAPVLGSNLIPPKARERVYPLTMSIFMPDANQRPTTLRFLIATRIERIVIPFDYRDLPVGDSR
ncbi:MAG: hypothetical protein IT435_06490 [Phycisphaerales bacterium]|nr:hypothetical protein [Phycisphaerales bacterium]